MANNNRFRLAVIESIEPSGTDGMFQATLGVRDTVNGSMHGMAIQVMGTDLTNCVERTHKVLKAFNE